MEPLVYLDHNIFNRMLKGEESAIRALLDSTGLVPVYSDENIDEIDRSDLRREMFLDLLIRLEARHIHVPLDENFRSTETVEILVKNPRDRLEELIVAREGYDLLDTGLDLLTKMYGGRGDTTATEIAMAQLDSVEEMIKAQLADPDIDDPELAEGKAMLGKLLDDLPTARNRIRSGLSDLDANGNLVPLLLQAQEELGIGPLQLNNVKPPGEIEQIWSMVGHAYGAPALNLHEFLQAALNFGNENGSAQPQVFQLVNAVYNWLNIVGFYRDENLHKSSRMRASFGDMTHAGYGIICKCFYCDDLRMRRKIAATYEYLDVKTKISELVLTK